jgi:hypothetical protein
VSEILGHTRAIVAPRLPWQRLSHKPAMTHLHYMNNLATFQSENVQETASEAWPEGGFAIDMADDIEHPHTAGPL